jgi:hypothetical protein
MVRNRIWPLVVSIALLPAASACGGGHPAGTPPRAVSAAPPDVSAPTGGVTYDGFEQVADSGWKPGINDVTDSRRQESLSQLEQQPSGPLRRVTAPTRDGRYALAATVPHALGSFRADRSTPTPTTGIRRRPAP